MTARYIWVQGQRYYLYESYDTWKKAYNIGRYFRRKNNCRYYIQTTEKGLWFPEKRYQLYLNKVCRLW